MELNFVPVRTAVRGTMDARMVFFGDRLVAVLVLLGHLYENNAGKWFLEVAFHEKIANIGSVFDSLSEAEEWIEASLKLETDHNGSVLNINSEGEFRKTIEIDGKTLNSISEALGLSVHDLLSGGDSVREVSKALDCMRLWFDLRTDEGRRRALECLSQIADEEQP